MLVNEKIVGQVRKNSFSKYTKEMGIQNQKNLDQKKINTQILWITNKYMPPEHSRQEIDPKIRSRSLKPKGEAFYSLQFQKNTRRKEKKTKRQLKRVANSFRRIAFNVSLMSS